jgi:antirestriction protein ArdC
VPKTRNTKTAARTDALTEIQARLVAALVESIETNPTDWTRPWRTALGHGAPANPITGKAYKGGNAWYFLAVAIENHYPTNAWAGFGQWQEHGLTVTRGQKATTGIYWSSWERIETDPKTGDDKTRRGMTPRPFKVFNLAQVEPITDPENPNYRPAKAEALLARFAEADAAHDPIPGAEAFFAGIGARVQTGGAQAAYALAADLILMPNLGAFDTPTDYYATLAHEHIHWTGHRSRLARASVVDGARYASAEYAAEELVAELGAVFVGAHLGLDVPPRQDENHAAYLAFWVAAMSADPKVLWSAASAAAKAADYLTAAATPPAEPACCAWCAAAGI